MPTEKPAFRLRLAFYRDDRGSAAIEFAAVAMLLVVILGNAVDFGVYEYRSMQVQEAAQVGAQTAWSAFYASSGNICNAPANLPATENCASFNAAITTAIQSTSLGTRAALASGYPTEGYYCVNSSGALQSVGSLSSKPSDCSAAGSASTSPGDYVQVAVTTAYLPIFPGFSVIGRRGASSISATSWMRLE
jgi:Flp pilus assembly protein TadG